MTNIISVVPNIPAFTSITFILHFRLNLSDKHITNAHYDRTFYINIICIPTKCFIESD